MGWSGTPVDCGKKVGVELLGSSGVDGSPYGLRVLASGVVEVDLFAYLYF